MIEYKPLTFWQTIQGSIIPYVLMVFYGYMSWYSANNGDEHRELMYLVIFSTFGLIGLICQFATRINHRLYWMNKDIEEKVEKLRNKK